MMQGGVADDPDTGGLDRLGLQRLMFDVFHEDIQLFRDYCLQVRWRDAGMVSLCEDDGFLVRG